MAWKQDKIYSLILPSSLSLKDAFLVAFFVFFFSLAMIFLLLLVVSLDLFATGRGIYS